MTDKAALTIVLDWVEEVLGSTDPDNDDSYFNDHPRECAESIAFDTRRDAVLGALEQLRSQP